VKVYIGKRSGVKRPEISRFAPVLCVAHNLVR